MLSDTKLLLACPFTKHLILLSGLIHSQMLSGLHSCAKYATVWVRVYKQGVPDSCRELPWQVQTRTRNVNPRMNRHPISKEFLNAET